MDGVQDFDEYRSLLYGLSMVDRCVLAHRPTFQFLNRVVAGLPRSAEPLHIVDVGCGSGDLLRKIAGWARRRRRAVRLTGVDLNPYAIRVAKETAGNGIEWVNEDALSIGLDTPVDIVVSCHFTHHLTSEQLVRFLQWMEANARRGWFINDLHREMAPYRMFQLFSRLVRLAPILRHDGLVSIRRSFQPEDWAQLCDRAGLNRRSYTVMKRYPARLCVSRLKAPAGNAASAS